MDPAEQSQILQLVEDGQLSVDEALRRLAAGDSAPDEVAPPTSQRWLRLRVRRLDTGTPKVQVNVPLDWLQLGLQLGTHLAPELKALDLAQIVAELEQNSQGRILEIKDLDDNQHIEIYLD